MIVPMKKVSLAVFGRDSEISLQKLREAGVLHINKKNVSSEALTKLMDRQARVRKAMAILSRYQEKKKGVHNAYMPTSDKDLVDYVLGLMDEKKTLQDQLLHNTRERMRVESWGDFDTSAFAELEKNGVNLVPYELSRRAYDALDKNVKLIVLSKDNRKVKALAVGDKIEGSSPIAFGQSLSQIDERIAYINKRVEEIEKEFKNQACRINILEDEEKSLPVDIEYEATKANMEEMEDVHGILWLQGYVPVDNLTVLKRTAVEHEWAILCDDPKPEDKPPTMIKNNSTISIIKPVFSFLGTVPGYREIDISAPFLVFFSIFVGMILGDAAYGTLFFTVSIIAGLALKIKTGKVPDILKLLMVLTFCTIIWGAINGSWFSIPVEHLPPFLTALILPPFNDTSDLIRFPGFLQNYFSLPEAIPKDAKSTWCIQFLCFSLALIHMCFARITCFVKTLPKLAAFSHIGYMFVLAGLYFLILNMLLKLKMQPFVVPLIGIGVGLNFIFSEQYGGNFFKNIGKSFANAISLILKAISTFADIISYIRLFAVGLAGTIIAETFNGMAIPDDGFGLFGVGFIVKVLACVLILALGHGLNLILAVLSVIVHAVRLNLLEFAGNHLNIEWSGYEYKPFALKQKK